MLKHINLEDFTFHTLEEVLDLSLKLQHWLESYSNKYDLLADNDVYRALWYLDCAVFEEIKRRFRNE